MTLSDRTRCALLAALIPFVVALWAFSGLCLILSAVLMTLADGVSR